MVPFDPKKHLIKVQGGRLYLPVAARLIWFRSEHPDWGIETEIAYFDPERKFAVFRAKIYDANRQLMAVGTKMEDVRGFFDYVEKAETGAVGRALALCGYGTQFAPEFDETPGRRLSDGFPTSDNGQGGEVETPHSRAHLQDHGDSLPVGVQVHSAMPVDGAEVTHSPVSISASATDHQRSHTESQVLECKMCSKPLNKSQVDLSNRNFGVSLCPACQKGKSRAV